MGSGFQGKEGIDQHAVAGEELEMEMRSGSIPAVADIADKLPRFHMVARVQIGREHIVRVRAIVIGSGRIIVEVSAQALVAVVAEDPEGLRLKAEDAGKGGYDGLHFGCQDVDSGMPVRTTAYVIAVAPTSGAQDGESHGDHDFAVGQGTVGFRRERGPRAAPRPSKPLIALLIAIASVLNRRRQRVCSLQFACKY